MEGDITLTEKNEGIKAAFDELVLLENDDIRRQEYNIIEKAKLDYIVQNRAAREEGFKEGFKEGFEKGIQAVKLQIVNIMLENGLSLEQISDVTELPIEKIKELKDEIDDSVKNEEVNVIAKRLLSKHKEAFKELA